MADSTELKEDDTGWISQPRQRRRRSKSLPNIPITGGGCGKRGKLLRTWLRVKRLLRKNKIPPEPSTSSTQDSMRMEEGIKKFPDLTEPTMRLSDEDEIMRNFEELQRRLSDELHPQRRIPSGSSSGVDWEMWKISTGQVRMNEDDLLKKFPEEFSRKFLEWENKKGYGGGQTEWIFGQLQKVREQQARLRKELKECEEREARLLEMARDLPPQQHQEFDQEEAFYNHENFSGESSSIDEGATEDSFAKSNTDSELLSGVSGKSRRRSSDLESSARSPSLSAFTESEEEEEADRGSHPELYPLKTVEEEREEAAESPSPSIPKQDNEQPRIIWKVKPVLVEDEEEEESDDEYETQKHCFSPFSYHHQVLAQRNVFVTTKRTIFTPVLAEERRNEEVEPPRIVGCLKKEEASWVEEAEEEPQPSTSTAPPPRRFPITSPNFRRKFLTKTSLMRSNSFQGGGRILEPHAFMGQGSAENSPTEISAFPFSKSKSTSSVRIRKAGKGIYAFAKGIFFGKEQ